MTKCLHLDKGVLMLIVLALLAVFFGGAAGGWNFSQGNGWGFFPSLIIAVIFGSVSTGIMRVFLAIVITVRNGIEEASYIRRYNNSVVTSKIAPPLPGISSPRTAEEALDSLVRRSQSKGNTPKESSPPAQPTVDETAREKLYLERLSKAKDLPPLRWDA